VTGAALLLLGRAITGLRDPTDNFMYYTTALVMAGFVAASCGPRHFWVAPIGVYCGQYSLMIFIHSNLWPFALILGVPLSVFSFAGALGPYFLWRNSGRAGLSRAQ
jgi:hypothetical protein